ncbi:MAG: transglycosylase SLT domain-containing protein [Gammaproteobacteria bacterium]
MMNHLRNLIVIGCLAMAPATALSGNRDQQRTDFLLAEKLIAQGNDDAFFNLAQALIEYPLYPYLQYQWLKAHLDRSGRILAYLKDYRATRYAGLLKAQWLSHLAERQQWREFVQHYEANGSTALECRFQWANYNLGRRQQALEAAKRLWSVGASQPPECEPLFQALTLSPMLTSDLIWLRFERALQAGNVLLANYLRQLFEKNDQDLAELWLQVHRKPALIRESRFLDGKDRRLARVFVHGIEQMAKSDLDLAVIAWDANKDAEALDGRLVQAVERRLALSMAHHRKPGAYDRLGRLPGDDEEIREWRVRSALFEQNWRHIADALSGLSPDELNDPRWQYWQARSLAVRGDAENARRAYLKLSEDRSFYGFLAADAVGRPYMLSDKPVFLGENELEALASENEFQAVRELKELNRDLEAERQWWHAVGTLSKERLAAAAKLAQFWHWDQLAIRTLVKADYWDDLGLRFPVDYLDQVQTQAYRRDLDPAMIFGLIRQESMLDSRAHSPVGARGLMQVMPKTGREIAQKLGERWQTESSLLDPELNIRYGAYYFKSLLDTFNGHIALATAAYNAGPARVRKWLPVLRPVPADLWVETIPFKETRRYVMAVLSYMIIYQYRIQRNGLRMENFMRDVMPG